MSNNKTTKRVETMSPTAKSRQESHRSNRAKKVLWIETETGIPLAMSITSPEIQRDDAVVWDSFEISSGNSTPEQISRSEQLLEYMRTFTESQEST